MLSDLRLYVRERILRLKIGVLWALLSCGIWLVVGEEQAHTVWILGIAALFIFSFRLLDDLADRAHDSAKHRERILVRTQHVNTFGTVSLGGMAGLALIIGFTLGMAQGLGVMALAGAVLSIRKAYSLRDERRSIVSSILLLKYPILIILLAAEPLRLSTITIAAAFYIIPFADEMLA
jgi:4-hydroxybenzoate polyprenyltransferase